MVLMSMPYRLACCVMTACFVVWGSEALALERTALALSGDGCRVSQQAMIDALERLDGVVQVRADVMPDHLLVDHDDRRRTSDELVHLVDQVAPPSCRAALMQSCITAEFKPRAGVLPAER